MRGVALGVALILVLGTGVAVLLGGPDALRGDDAPGTAAPIVRPLLVRAGPAEGHVDAATRRRLADDPKAAARWLSLRRTFRGKGLRGRVEWRAASAPSLAAAAAGVVDEVVLRPRVTEVALTLPAIRQAYRNNCETAALSMALRGRVNQRRLQSLLPVAAPLGYYDDGAGRVWGDPQRGFVGRVEGGGFGVFERPLARLGGLFDRNTSVVRASSFDEVLDEVRRGRPVVVWAALGGSVPTRWRTPAGQVVLADLSEHTVVIAGVGPNGVVIHDPWTGEVRVETASSLAERWARLGRRTLATGAETALLTRAR